MKMKQIDLDRIIELARQISEICCEYDWTRCDAAEIISNAAGKVMDAVDPYYNAD